jgi:hypothetical protein
MEIFRDALSDCDDLTILVSAECLMIITALEMLM